MIARVALEIALRKEFDYLVPVELEDQIAVGSRVKVPFGTRQVLGCVTALADHSEYPQLRPLVGLIGRPSLVTVKVLHLARWIGEYYCCPLEIALKSVLPDAVRKEKPFWKQQRRVRSMPPPQPFPKLTPRQKVIWDLIESAGEMPLQELLVRAKTTTATIKRLENSGLLAVTQAIAERDPYANEHLVPTQPLTLNPEQVRALRPITAAMDSLRDDPAVKSGKESTFLLHGVTGSGKTEIYLQAIAHALRHGQGAIVLVPEISLTPQTVERFKSRFCSGPLKTMVAVLHSHLSAGERHDEWHKIRQGRARIVVGARSAIFAPIEPLGLIVVDEEHEHSYKQEEAPRYHARDVAVVRGQHERAVVVLGSATPSLESYFNTQRGKYSLLELPTRVDDQTMPLVRVVDMRHEQRLDKAPPILSRRLREAIHQRLEKREQTMLFLNRRGYASSLQCPQCGYVAQCQFCSVSLTYHRQAQELRCHICGHQQRAPVKCPADRCGSPAIRFAGLGTEKVEDVLQQVFPHARIRRMDSDVMKRKEDYRRVLGDFRTGKIDILVGTQMIAKGLHFPNVTLVGIVYADLSLHVPDFRAGERTFQLLTQVAGRAGRGEVEGEVIVQTLTPFHPAIQFARRHDFPGFFEQELEFRQQLNYPPISHVALITVRGRNEEKVRFCSEHVRRELEPLLAGWKDTVVAGPAPAPLVRAESYYRYQIMVRTRLMSRLSGLLSELTAHFKLPDDTHLSVDIDPMNLI
jgi:primosomal protein N' (replication factor Y) (superfamily II helicase)